MITSEFLTQDGRELYRLDVQVKDKSYGVTINAADLFDSDVTRAAISTLVENVMKKELGFVQWDLTKRLVEDLLQVSDSPSPDTQPE